MQYTSYDDIIEAKLIEQGDLAYFSRTLLKLKINEISTMMNETENRIELFESGLLYEDGFSDRYFNCIEKIIINKNIKLKDVL